MKLRLSINICLLMCLPLHYLYAQEDLRAWLFSGTVYDEHFIPVPYTNVVAHGTGQGDMTDSMGIFSLYVRATDQLSFYNISFHDTTLFVVAAQPELQLTRELLDIWKRYKELQGTTE
jgi:hypothetical protein